MQSPTCVNLTGAPINGAFFVSVFSASLRAKLIPDRVTIHSAHGVLTRVVSKLIASFEP